MITGVDLISDSLAIMLDGSGGGTPAVLGEKTITENGVYYPHDETPRLDGYNKVTVNVETYEEEYEEMKECCDEVVEVIQQYDPDYDPEDPEEPTIPEKIEEIIEEESGYTFPVGTELEPIIDIIPVDPVEDTATHVSIQIGGLLKARNNDNPDFPAEGIWIAGCREANVALAQQYGVNPTWSAGAGGNTYGELLFYVKATDTTTGTVYMHSLYGGGIIDYPEYAWTLKSFSIDPTNGHITHTTHLHYIQPWGSHQTIDEDFTLITQYDVGDLIGYGTGQYKVTNTNN